MIGLLTGRGIAAYMGLPQFKLRLEELFMGGFQFIAYFMALVYSAVNLLPANHPYTHAYNMGKFGIRNVIAEAANNLTFKKENTDQILLFVAILIGLVLIFMQICLLGASLFMQPVLAAMPTNFAEFFLTPTATETTDIAHIMMDLVFGVGEGAGGNNLFNSCVAQQITCTEAQPAPSTGRRDVMAVGGTSIYSSLGFPFPIHVAMHQMFQLYNTGLLVVAVIIATYFIITIVIETAQTGTPFGKRFNKVWAPLRIVFAIGMLVPVGYGFNGSQWSVLYAAKFGSGFATNGWNLFNASLTDGFFGDTKDLVSSPNIPEVKSLLQFFYVARTCAYLEEWSSIADPPKEIKMYAVRGSKNAANLKALEIADSTSYQELYDFNEGQSTIRLRFGIQGDEFNEYIGSVYPSCGEITFKLSDARNPTAGDVLDQPEAGVLILQEYYFRLLQRLWFTVINQGLFSGQNYPRNTVYEHSSWQRGTGGPTPDAQFRAELTDWFRDELELVMLDPGGALEQIENSDRYNVNGLIREKGWAGAAIWYNRIAEMNGAVSSAVLNVPYPSLFPAVQEHVLTEKKRLNNNVPFDTRFEPSVADGRELRFQEDEHNVMADVLWIAFEYWQNPGGSSTHIAPTGNAMIDSINALFGTEGLYNIRRNPDTHPLAQIVGIGRSLVESAIRNLTISVIGGVGGNLLGFLDNSAKELVQTMSTFLITVTMVGLTAGFVLFYVVPFLPFIYFFFAVGGWIKGIFEAMVGAPLWALAHIRIDQDGLPGQAGVAGYFLIFEIFLRPVLIIFGMLASISIFSALVTVLNQIFDLVTSNVGGFDNRAEVVGTAKTINGDVTVQSTLNSARSAVDEFFFTVIYTIIIYLMALSSFKLIDLIPNNILRWMGQSTATFNDQNENAAEGLVGKATVGAQQTSGALSGGLKALAR